MSTITLHRETCWLIRSPSPKGGFVFHEAANGWNRSPAHATIYRSEDAARRMIDDMRHHRRAGFRHHTIAEPVPMHGALLTCGRPIAASGGQDEH